MMSEDFGEARKDGTPKRIRTSDLRIRNPLLYPAELWAHKNLCLGEHDSMRNRNNRGWIGSEFRVIFPLCQAK